MTPRLRTCGPPAAVAAALVLAGCGGSAPTAAPAGLASASASPSAASTSGASAASTPSSRPGGGAAGPAAGTAGAAGAAAPGGPAGSGPGAGTAGQPGTAPAGSAGTAASRFTAAGTYTYDTSGTVTVGAPHDATGTATLTVDPATGGRQHSVLAGRQGRSEQDVVVRAGGSYLAQLSISNPAFSKEFRPAAPVLLVPAPASPGRSWSWTAKSTDGKTTLTVTARVARQETVTIGGARVLAAVVVSTLRLSGDVSYTSRLETWYDAAHRLTVKEHSRGNGTYGGVAFSTDVTRVLRSTRPA